ncbi:MAG: hydroxymethylbilane synthase [Armatimonadota bacterium]
MSITRRIRLGTRGSMLALTQSRWVASHIEQLGWEVSLEVIRTLGDDLAAIPTGKVDVKGLFVNEIEQALLQNRIDLAVHSMKDLPPEMPDGLIIASIPRREDPRDVLIGRTAPTLCELPSGSIIGSSSPRRRAQLLAARSDIEVRDLRGNVDTRLRKLDEGQYDAICIAAAGLNRLGFSSRITEYLDTDVVLPAAGQGALALQVRSSDEMAALAVLPLHHEESALVIRTELAVLRALGWGCSVPLGILAVIKNDTIRLTTALCSLDGKTVFREQVDSKESPEDAGLEMACRLREIGGHLLE